MHCSNETLITSHVFYSPINKDKKEEYDLCRDCECDVRLSLSFFAYYTGCGGATLYSEFPLVKNIIDLNIKDVNKAIYLTRVISKKVLVGYGIISPKKGDVVNIPHPWCFCTSKHCLNPYDDEVLLGISIKDEDFDNVVIDTTKMVYPMYNSHEELVMLKEGVYTFEIL